MSEEISSRVDRFIQAVEQIAKGESDDLRDQLKGFEDIDVLIGYVEEFEKALAKVINRQRRAFVKIIKSQVQKADPDPSVLKVVEHILGKAEKDADFSKEFSEASRKFFDKSVPDLTSRVMDLIDKEVPFETLSPVASEWIKDWSGDLGKLMNLTSHRGLQSALQKGIDEGLGIDKIARELEGMPQFTRRRARVTAITETLTASSVSQNEAYRQSPSVTGKKWRHSGPRRITPRDNHVALDGTVVDKNGTFDVSGYWAQFPRDVSLPAKERVQCHCTMSPVVDDKVLGLSPEEKQRIRDSITNPDGGTPPVDRKPVKLPETPKVPAKTPKKVKGPPKVDPGTQGGSPPPKAKKAPKKTLHDAVQERIRKGVMTEKDVREVGKIIREEGQSKVKKAYSEHSKLVLDFEKKKEVCIDLMHRKKVYKRGTKQFSDEYIAAHNEYFKAREAVQTSKDALLPDLQKTWRDLLGEVREFGHPLKQTWQKGTHYETIEAFDKEKDLFPRDWLDYGVKSPMKGLTAKRGYYNHNGEILTISGDREWQRSKVLIHEMGHRFEDKVPRIKLFERQFFQRRTAGEVLREMPGYNPPEYALYDKFLLPYMGKSYGGPGQSWEAYEILSMGLESLFSSSYNILDDTDFADFILGLLAAV